MSFNDTESSFRHLRSPLQQLDFYRFRSANFSKWARFAFWKSEELVALTLGIDPLSIKLEHASDWTPNFRWEYLYRYELVLRATSAGQIEAKCPPARAIEWLERIKLLFPRELKEQVQEYHPIIDEKTALLKLLSHVIRNERQVSEHCKQLDDKQKLGGKETAAQLVQNSQAMESLQKLLSEGLSDSETAAQPLLDDNSVKEDHPKASRSKNILIATMALQGYKFPMPPKRSNVITEIVSDASSVGLTICFETARRHIIEAIENVGAQPPSLD